MIARWLKWLMLGQLLAAALLAWIAWRFWHMTSPLLAVAFGVFAVLLVRVLITAQNFLHSWSFRSDTPAQCALSTTQMLRLFGEEFLSTMRCTSWSMLHARAYVRAGKSRQMLPVLLVHGYGCNSGYWDVLVGRLERVGISVATVDLEPALAGIDDYAPLLRDALAALCQASGVDSAIILAHSMGGLAARAHLRAHGAARVAHVITLGSPHHGTCLANAGVGINAGQMRRNGDQPSDWLSALGAGESAQDRRRITSIYTHHDNIVVPQSSAHLPGARNLAFGGIGHVALGANARIAEVVLAEIARVSAQDASRGARVADE